MNLFLSAAFFAINVTADLALPMPKPFVGDALPPGAVARFGPTQFYYAGWVMPLHTCGTPTVWYSPDGKCVAVTATTGVYVWDAATGKRLVWVPSDRLNGTAVLGFHPDGDVYVHCWRKWDDSGAGVYRLDPLTGKVKAKFRPAEARWFGPVSPDGKLVFSRTTVNVMEAETVANDPDTGKEVWRRKIPDAGWLRVSPDGSRLVTWSSAVRWSALVLDTATGKTVDQFAHPDGTPSWTSGGLAISAKAEWVVSAHGWDRGTSIFRAGTEKPFHREKGAWDDYAFFPKEGTKFVLLRGRPNATIEVWDAATQKVLSSAKANVSGVAALSPDGGALVVAGTRANPHALQFFEVVTGKRKAQSPDEFTANAVVWYTPDGALVSSHAGLKYPVKWDAKTGAAEPLAEANHPPIPKVPAGFNPPTGTTGLVASPDGKRVLGYRFDPDELDSAPGDTYLGLFEASGKIVKRFERPDATSGASYRFPPDGKVFAISRGDGRLAFHDAATGEEFGAHRTAGGAGWMAFSPAGNHLALAGGDAPIVVWEVPRRK